MTKCHVKKGCDYLITKEEEEAINLRGAKWKAE